VLRIGIGKRTKAIRTVFIGRRERGRKLRGKTPLYLLEKADWNLRPVNKKKGFLVKDLMVNEGEWNSEGKKLRKRDLRGRCWPPSMDGGVLAFPFGKYDMP
jgi:hypothetical protein